MRRSPWMGVCLSLALTAPILPRTAQAASGGGREQEAFADEAIGQMRASAASVRQHVAEARSSKDAVLAVCLNGKLTQLETAQRQALDARGSLRRASLREDMDAIARASTLITQLDGRVRQLRAEADACVGRERFLDQSIQAAQVTVSGELEQRVVVEKSGVRDERPPAFTSAPVASPAPAPPPPATPSVPFGPTPAAAGSPYAVEASREASMLAYSADMTLAVFQVDKGLGAVEALAKDLGGYLAQRADTQVTVKVPRPRFDEAIGRIEKLGDVLHRNVSAEDVTDEYVDLELRLKNARAMRDQLVDLLKGAAVKDAVEIEKELAKVTEVIEQIEGRLKVLRDKVGYSSITVSFQANAPATVRSTAILPFAWLDTIGLEPLLNVPKVSR
jgi:Domain of unknown function (DUF4349)